MRFSTTLDRIRESRKPTPYSEMTLEQLETVSRELTQERYAIKLELRKLVKLIDFRYAQGEAVRKLETMSDAQKVALAQAVNTQGIPTGEEFGNLTT